jgi:hypothetical protein
MVGIGKTSYESILIWFFLPFCLWIFIIDSLLVLYIVMHAFYVLL